MAKFHWVSCNKWQQFKLKVQEEWFILKVTFWSLFYNQLTSWGTVFDAALEPMFWFVDHFIRYLGPAFVLLVIVLTSSVVIIFYVCLLPHKMSESFGWSIYHFVFGHWLLVNIVFNYFKASFTDPGQAPMVIPEVVSICKKCIAPKPPRAHHCSVCQKCILRMDHHCPWLNNCVGHNNHRYFFMFCFYMWVGTIYVSISAYPLFKEHFYGDSAIEIGWSGVFYPYYLARNGFSKEAKLAMMEKAKKSLILQNIDPNEVMVAGQQPHDVYGMYFHTLIIYEFMLCSAVTFALTLLLLWHARLVTRAETSIEMHINKTESIRQKKKGIMYKNPYDFGVKQNWIIFLGLTHGRTLWRHLLLPSSHCPDENGLHWRTIWSRTDNLQEVVML